MFIRLATSLCFLGIIISCDNYNGSINIKDVSRDTIISIKSTNRNPSVLVLKVNGTIDSDIAINSVIIPKGNVNKKILLDSYSQITEIKYEHKNVQAGKLSIKYKY